MMSPGVNNALSDGLQRTLAMRLSGHPPADAADGMFQAWVAAFDALPLAWDDSRDVPRICTAFARLWADCDKWPAPKMLIERLPPIPEPLKLEAKRPPLTPEQLAAHNRRMAAIIGSLSAKTRIQPEKEKQHD